MTSPPPVHQCPRCLGLAALDRVALMHWCAHCRDFVQRIRLEMDAEAGLVRSPAFDVSDTTQRRWWRWLTTWGPRIAAWVRGRLHA